MPAVIKNLDGKRADKVVYYLEPAGYRKALENSNKLEMIHKLNFSEWESIVPPSLQREAMSALENGSVLYFPALPFTLMPHEKRFLTPHALGKSKNICFNRQIGSLKGSIYNAESSQDLQEMLLRFVRSSEKLIKNLLPCYQPYLIHGRTSYRPIEVLGRKTSVRQDDTRLHVDAFPATPNQGFRILRVFSNINPQGKPRVWNLGEPFETVVKKFAHAFKRPIFGSRALLAAFKITKSYRSLYDHYMLLLHDAMKMDESYQGNVQKKTFHFPAGSTWIVMTDSVSHAALSGQYLLEHTFYLPPEKMQDPSLSPLAILEKVIGGKKMASMVKNPSIFSKK